MPADNSQAAPAAGAGPSPRLLAARLVGDVLQRGESLNSLLAARLGEVADPRERALVQELVFGTLRWYHRLDWLLGELLDKPLRKKDHDIHALLLVGLYQLFELDMPAHAAVHETVDAARKLGKAWARGLVNAVLRNAQRRRDSLLAGAATDPVAHWSYPSWWLERVQADWPAHWQAVLAAGNRRPPMTLRVNQRQGGRAAYQAKLQAAGLQATAVPAADTALELAEPVAVERLPGFHSGAVSVQDAGAQLAVPLLLLEDGQRVLDACAAPGGKTGHILESAAQLAGVVALDADQRRLQKVADNLQRLRLTAHCVCADAADTRSWWDGRRFDRILLDAPCSASGVVRRHPDIKLLRRETDLPALAGQQQRLLEALWPLLNSGGILLYVTCSLFNRENGDVVQAFIARHADARLLSPEASWGQAQGGGRQLLPGEQGMDGFYFARMIKT